MFTVVIPIHNQESIIRMVLDSVVEMTVGSYELILILDGCTDNTPSIVRTWVQDHSSLSIRVLENNPGRFETSCDNQGFRLANREYIVEIQADMVLQTFGYNVLLASPLEQYPDMIAVSGRCCHGLNGNTPSISVGKLGPRVEFPHTVLPDKTVYLSHTVNRGPLVLRTSMVRTLGYLDEDHYVLGNDEHDLFARAWYYHKWRCGFVPVEVYSPLNWGSTRKPRSSDAQSYLTARQANESTGFLALHRNTMTFPAPESREFKIQRRLLGEN